MSVRPFGPHSRTGFELELLAPRGRSRLDLARAVAEEVGGALEHGLKYYSEGEAFPDGRPVCRLTPAARVLDPGGEVLLTLVDDNTIREDLDAAAPPDAFVAVMDDVRLAKLAERLSWTGEPGAKAAFSALAALFEGRLLDSGECVDRFGHPLARLAPLGGERARVAEVVTRPLHREERGDVIQKVLTAVHALGFTVPAEAALHLHLDHGPWRTTPALRRLIRRYAEERPAVLGRWRPNPRCRKLGPFPAPVVRVAHEAEDGLAFEVFAAALKLAGVEKGLDLNLLGIIEAFPLHPTLEVRALPQSLEAAEVLRVLDDVETTLSSWWEER